jgi:hypothetical protein
VEEPTREKAEAEILRDVEPVVKLVKEILHFGRSAIGSSPCCDE